MTAFHSKTRTRRIASCFGDGAAAIPRDPTHLGFIHAGAASVHLDTRTGEIYGSMGSLHGVRTIGMTCLSVHVEARVIADLIAIVSLLHACSSCDEKPAYVPWASAVDQPRTHYLRPIVIAFCEAMRTIERSVRLFPVCFDETASPGGGLCVRIGAEHAFDKRIAFFTIRRTWGQVWIEDVDFIIPTDFVSVLRSNLKRVVKDLQ